LLDKPFQINSHVDTIPLPQPNEEFTGLASLTGWAGKASNILKKAEVSIVPNEKCRRIFPRGWDEVTDGIMCAGDERPGSCVGNNGDPVGCKRSDGSSVLCGLIKKSINCGRPGYPVMHTKVSYYLDWIENSIGDIQSMIE